MALPVPPQPRVPCPSTSPVGWLLSTNTPFPQGGVKTLLGSLSLVALRRSSTFSHLQEAAEVPKPRSAAPRKGNIRGFS